MDSGILGLEATGGVQIEDSSSDSDPGESQDIVLNASPLLKNKNLIAFQKPIENNPPPIFEQEQHQIIQKNTEMQNHDSPISDKKSNQLTIDHSEKSKIIENLLKGLNPEIDENLIPPRPIIPLKLQEINTDNTVKTNEVQEMTQMQEINDDYYIPSDSVSDNNDTIETNDSNDKSIETPSFKSDSSEVSEIDSDEFISDYKPVPDKRQTQKPVRKAPQREFVQIKQTKQKSIKSYSRNKKEEVGRDIEIYRMILKIKEFFNDKYSVPEILATIHINAGNVKLAVDCLSQGQNIGKESDLLKTSSVKTSLDSQKIYFHV